MESVVELPRDFGFNISNFDSSLTYQASMEVPSLERWRGDNSNVSHPSSLETFGGTVISPGGIDEGQEGHPGDVSPTGGDMKEKGLVDGHRSLSDIGEVTENKSIGDHTVTVAVGAGAESPSEKDPGYNTGNKNQLEATLDWLDVNYERADGVCLPRCVLYTHYLELCKRRGFSPAGAATFGKIIRQRFPKLTTRRLGTRGQSKYHYYGIGIKESSVYYQSVYSGRGLTRFSGTKVKTEGSSRKYSLSSKTGTLLPDFPKAADLILGNHLQHDKVETFIVMYRTHCQRILDTVISANFEEVQSFLLHFWQGMPEHLQDLLDESLISDLVAFCDSILYKVLLDVLIPTTIQDLPDSLMVEMKVFIRRLPDWVSNCLGDTPEKLKRKKLEMVQYFTRCLKRHLSFVHLAQTSRGMLQCPDTTDRMLDDLEQVEFERVCLQVAYMQPELLHNTSDKINKYFGEFRSLLKKQSSIEAFTEWIDNLVDARVIEYSKMGGRSLKEEASTFILHWSLFSSLLLRDLTLHNAKTFGSFHLLYMTFNEYIFLIMETQQTKAREEEQRKHIKHFIRNSEDISMKAKLRTDPNFCPTQSKVKKRKEQTDLDSDNAEISPRGKDFEPPSATLTSVDELKAPTQTHQEAVTTAFSKPTTHSDNSSNGFPTSTDNQESISHQCGHNPQPILKPLPSLAGGGSYGHSGSNNNTFLSHLHVGFGVGVAHACPPEYVTSGATNPSPLNSLSSPVARMHSQMDPLTQMLPNATASMQIPGNCFSIGSNSSHSGSYWSDSGSRTHPGYPDSYHGLTHHVKHSQGYENYGRSSGTFLRTGVYTDAFQSAFDPARGFYSRGTENYPSGALPGGSLGMASYGNSVNYMEVTPPCGQYPRQENIFNNHQQDTHDLYSGYVPANITSLNKPYVTPFR